MGRKNRELPPQISYIVNRRRPRGICNQHVVQGALTARRETLLRSRSPAPSLALPSTGLHKMLTANPPLTPFCY